MSEQSDIVKPTLAALEAIPGVFAYRIQSGIAKVRGGWMHLAPAGTPDIGCVVGGRAVFFEAKLKGAEFKKTQLPMHERMRRAGARVEVIRSVREAVEVVRTMLEGTS